VFSVSVAESELRTRQRGSFPAAWPIVALFAFAPIWWVLGLGNLIYVVFGAVMAASLVASSEVRVPRGLGIWFLFLGWVLASATQLDRFTRVLAFTHRFSIYFTATVLLLFIYNAKKSQVSTATIARVITIFWLFVVFGGVIAMIWPYGGFPTITQSLLPKSLASNNFMVDLVHPRFSQVQDFLGSASPRPAAPFVYTNQWGANLTVLIPFVLGSWRYLSPGLKRAAVVGAALSVVPMVYSVNRGMWLTLVVSALYGVALLALRGHVKPMLRLGLVTFALVALVLVTPMRGVVQARLDSPHSNSARLGLYAQVQDQIQESPLLGFGSPRSNEENPLQPPVGSHGQFWAVLFSHGIPGLALYVAAMVSLSVKTMRPKNTSDVWFHVAIASTLASMWFYELFSAALLVVFVAAGILLRDRDEVRVEV
jgi:polysaccharide biosynthesis protein PslJ